MEKRIRYAVVRLEIEIPDCVPSEKREDYADDVVNGCEYSFVSDFDMRGDPDNDVIKNTEIVAVFE